MSLALRGATVVDGSGAPGVRTDVLVEDGVITRVADLGPGEADETVDLAGLVLAPGFIDPHTHYDAQVLWDRDLTPSSWHGVTSVVMGNCGFGIAPVSAPGRELVMRTLENVEGMPLEALRTGIPWTFESFPEYLDAVDAQPLRCNVAALFGHTPLRFYVMGEEATERAATPDEVGRMRDLLIEGMRGWGHRVFDLALGVAPRRVRPPGAEPARRAQRDLDARRRHGSDRQGHRRSDLGTRLPRRGMRAARRSTSAGRSPGRPSWWSAENPAMSEDLERRVAAAGGAGTLVFPQVACRPIVAQVTLADPAPLANVPAFGEILSLEREARTALYRDPQWRERAYAGVREKWGSKLDDATVQETARPCRAARRARPWASSRRSAAGRRSTSPSSSRWPRTSRPASGW